MGQTYKAFYSLWMRGFPLSECKRRAMSKYPYDEDDPSYTTLYFPLGKNYGSWSPGHARPRPNDFELRIYGYPRVTRNSFQQ